MTCLWNARPFLFKESASGANPMKCLGVKIMGEFYMFSKNQTNEASMAISFKEITQEIRVKCYEENLQVAFTCKIQIISTSKCFKGWASGVATIRRNFKATWRHCKNLSYLPPTRVKCWLFPRRQFWMTNFAWVEKIEALEKDGGPLFVEFTIRRHNWAGLFSSIRLS